MAPGLGASNVCALEGASSDDALLPALLGRPVDTLAIFVTQLLTDVHPHILRAVLVSKAVASLLCS